MNKLPKNEIEWLGEENTLGVDIWRKKYRKSEEETFVQWLDRISNGNEDLRNMIIEKKFLFGGRILANRGLQNDGYKITYSNCYVIAPPEDNIESIFETASKLARTYSYGGGCGIDLKNLRPEGFKVNNAARKTSGATSFMDVYSTTTEVIGQNGRRGALMISMPISHPDVESFIKIKSDLNRVTKANISVRIDKEFMECVKKNEQYPLTFDGKIVAYTDARELFMELVEQNWDFAEPGILYWDRISEYNILQYDNDFEYAGTNPCAEEPLPAGGSCLLGSINLAEFVVNPFKEDSYFDLRAFEETVQKSVTALNEVLDEGLPLHPLQEQRDSVRDWRQIGLTYWVN